MREQAQRREARKLEAMQSPKWDNKVVAERNLAWLKQQRLRRRQQPDDDQNDNDKDKDKDKDKDEIPQPMTLHDYAGTILHRMVVDGWFASAVCRMLDLWKAWADNGGMRKSDLAALQKDQETFSQASVLLAIIGDTSGALEGTLSMDMQECLRMWRIVRLG